MKISERSNQVLIGVVPELDHSATLLLRRLADEAGRRGIGIGFLLTANTPALKDLAWQAPREHVAHPAVSLPPDRRNVWLARRSGLYDYGVDKAQRWYERQARQASWLLAEGPPTAFYCWNRACCLQGCLGELLEAGGVPVGTIEWGCLPESFLVTARRQNFRGWRCPDPLPDSDTEAPARLPAALSVGTGLYRQPPPALEHHPANLLAAKSRGPKVVYLGFSEVDSFACPADHADARTYLPFSASCLDLARQISDGNPDGVTVFKPHPLHNPHATGRAGDRLWIVDGDPAAWIRWADVVVAGGSKLELTAALDGKPVVCVGGGLLWGSGLSADVHTPHQLRQALRNPPPADRGQLNRWVARMARQELLCPVDNGTDLEPFFRSLDQLRQRPTAATGTWRVGRMVGRLLAKLGLSRARAAGQTAAGKCTALRSKKTGECQSITSRPPRSTIAPPDAKSARASVSPPPA